MSKHTQLPYDKDVPLKGALSPHELDSLYLSETTGDGQVHELARSKDLVVDVTMTNFVRAYKFENLNFVADVIAPRKSVVSKSGRYKQRGQEALDIHVSDLLGDRGMANELSYSVSETTYYIDPHGLVGFVSDEEIEESGAINAATEVTILLKAAVALRQEIRVRNLADAADASHRSTPGTDWDTSSAIHTDIAAAKQSMKALLGFGPTHFVIGDHVADEIVANSAVKSDITAAMSVADGRAFLEVMNGSDLTRFKPWGLQVVLPDSMYNTAAPGILPRTLARVWGDDGYMIRVDNEMRSMTWCLQFELLKETIVRWRSDNPGGWYYKILYKRVAKEVMPDALWKLIDLT